MNNKRGKRRKGSGRNRVKHRRNLQYGIVYVAKILYALIDLFDLF